MIINAILIVMMAIVIAIQCFMLFVIRDLLGYISTNASYVDYCLEQIKKMREDLGDKVLEKSQQIETLAQKMADVFKDISYLKRRVSSIQVNDYHMNVSTLGRALYHRDDAAKLMPLTKPSTPQGNIAIDVPDSIAELHNYEGSSLWPSPEEEE